MLLHIKLGKESILASKTLLFLPIRECKK